MILQSLYRYYEILAEDPDSGIAPPGYSSTGVSFALNLSNAGELLDVFPLFEQVQQGNKTFERPRRMLVPEQLKRSGSAPPPNFLCDNAAYVLGLSEKAAADPDYGRKRFEAFRQFHQGLLVQAGSPTAIAMSAFLAAYDPQQGRTHPAIAPKLEQLLLGGNLVFICNGQYAHEDPAIRQVWERYKAGKEAVLGQCLVTGETAPIARLHASLKGIRGANPTGASLVSFNDQAYESFNKAGLQGLNSPVSEKAVFGYTTALNYLLSSANPHKKINLGDTTVVYWAESRNPGFAAAFEDIFDPPEVEVETPAVETSGRKKVEKALGQAAEKVRRVQKLDLDALLQDLQAENPRFYVLGLAPNAARISVRFFLTSPFQEIVERLMQHYRDLEIVKEYDNQPDYVTIGFIINETVSKKAKDPQAAPLLAGAVARAVLSGAPYPEALFTALITRVRADMDDAKQKISKINYVRAAALKACLLRKYRRQPQHPIQEVLCMSLNEKSDYAPYVLGRLFAVLEKVQLEAVGNVNASIKDRYFTSACASPASVFPVLLRLSQHHINKAEWGHKSDLRIQDILNLLDVESNPIPARLNLDEQGAFILGYYHQRAAFYVKAEPAAQTETSH